MSTFDVAMEVVRKVNLRMDATRRALEATLLGTPEQHAEAERERRHAAIMDQLATHDPSPEGSTIPRWRRKSWAKRLLGR